jgi:hypothetical protein
MRCSYPYRGLRKRGSVAWERGLLTEENEGHQEGPFANRSVASFSLFPSVENAEQDAACFEDEYADEDEQESIFTAKERESGCAAREILQSSLLSSRPPVL